MLDGGYVSTQIITVVADDVTIADLTISHAYNHAIHVKAGADDTVGTVVHNVAVIDPGQQGIKINTGDGTYADDGVISCSLIELTDAGRPEIRDDCYTGGVDAHQTRGWVVRDNEIRGFWCDVGLSEHGVHFWRSNADAVIERNVIVDCTRGIGLGLTTSPPANPARTYADIAECQGLGYLDDWRGTVRNNVVLASDPDLFASAAGFDSGVGVLNGCAATVVHNTVWSSEAPRAGNGNSIEWRFEQTTALVANNWTSHLQVSRDDAQATELSNLTEAATSMLVDPSGGDAHLAPGFNAAVDYGTPLDPGVADDDVDAQPRDATPDIGADERTGS